MKTLGGIGAMILGVVAILVSIGLQTIWAPPATFEATTHDATDAPLTIVTEGIDIDPDDAIQYTVRGDGDFTLMYGQLRDIEAWVGDAAHNVIDGVDTEVERGEDPTMTITYVDGEAEVPNPVNSDLWLATQDVTDEVTQRWARADAGEWALLIAVDGTAPAPTDFSVSWVNIEPNSGWIMPLLVAGIALIILGIGLLIWRFMEFRRRAKRTSGRRAIVRGDYTGLTAADVMATNEPTTQSLAIEQVEAGEPVEELDDAQQTEIVAGLPRADEQDDTAEADEPEMLTAPALDGPTEDPTDEADAESHEVTEESAAEALTETEEVPADDEQLEDKDPQEEDSEDNGSDADDSDDDSDDTPGESGDDAADTAAEDASAQDPDEDTEPKGSSFLRRTATALSALGLAVGLGVGPAHAQTQDPEEDISEQVDQEQLEEEVDPEEPDTFPVVVDAQFDKILNAVASTVAAGDESLEADTLTGRVAGHALRVRQDSYRANTIDEDYPDRAAIGADEILATWMDRDASFPRMIYAVTAGEDGAATQLLALRQETARDQYKLVHNTPFAPGAELPTGNLLDHDVENLAAEANGDLVMSPLDAVEAFSATLDDPEADEAEAIADNEWIDAIHEHQADLVETHSENEVEVSVSRSVFDDSVTAVRLPNGSALVFGTMNSLESLTPEEGGTVDVSTVVQEIGGFESASQEDRVRIRYREQFALLVPQDGEISLAGYETVLSTVD